MAKKVKNQAVSKTKSSIEDRMIDLTKKENPIAFCFYGKSGTGKTTLLSTFPKPILLIDIKDKGDESAKSPDLQEGDIVVFEVSCVDDLYDLYDYLVENKKKFKTVGIDHLSAFQEMSHQQVMADENKTKMSQQLYGFSAGIMKEVIALYKDLTDEGIIPVFLAQDRLEGGEGEGEDQLMPEVGPGIMPSVAKLLCASCRVVGHTYLQEAVEKTGDMKVHRSIEYRLRLGPNPYYTTKVTKPKGYYCPSYIVDPTYDDIMKVIRGGYKEPGKDKKKIKKSKKK